MIDPARWSPSFSRGDAIVSYSQNAEDIRLWRVFGAIPEGFYVDVGAADPVVDSVTRLFYEHGWSGINIEPSPCFDALQVARNRDVNLNVAVGEHEGTKPFFLTYPYLGMSTLDLGTHAGLTQAIDRVQEVTVRVRRLQTILAEHAASQTIHFLKVDVEGAEREVLASSDWTVFRPIVVVVESIEPWSTSSTHESWEYVLLEAGYQFAAFDGINRFYVDHAHEGIAPVLAYPVSALDGFMTAATRELTVELERSRESLRSLEREIDSLRRSRDAAHRSCAWRVSRILRRAARPLRAARRRLGDGRSR